MDTAASTKRRLWAALLLLALLALACFAVPMYVIRPIRLQGAQELAVALIVRRWGPLVAALAAASSVAVCVILWRSTESKMARAFATLGALAAFGATWLVGTNVYEIMFHPLGAPSFTAAPQAKIDADDMVLMVVLNRDAHAYPIRTMGYHHVVNDRVGGLPIVSTY
jgi:hypothetical protein